MHIKASVLLSLIVSLCIACVSLIGATYAHAEPLTQNAVTAQKMMPITPPTSVSNPCTDLPIELSHGLSRGMRDSIVDGDVMKLQKFLSLHFGTPEQEIITGYFGPITEAHVIRFQKERGITPIGIVGPLTRNALTHVCGVPVDEAGPQISITSPGNSAHFSIGDTIIVSWTTKNVLPKTGMYLKLEVADGEKEIIKSITVPYASGSAQMSTNEFCNSNFSDAIHGECENLKEVLRNGKVSFKILAGLYTPEGACFGFCAPSTTPTVILKEVESAPFNIEDPDADAFTATHTTGKAPLTTQFSIARAGKFILNFGDETNTSFTIPGIMCITTPCNPPPKAISHTYKKPGTYYTALTRTTMNTCDSTNGTMCPLWATREETMGTITIEVTK